MAPLRIGVIGLSTQGWASSAHVTAFDQLKDTIKLTALSTRRAESAKEAAEKYDVKGYHGDPAQIAQDPNVDLVVVSVAAPYHKEAVWPAIEAGKDVFVEWPLGKVSFSTSARLLANMSITEPCRGQGDRRICEK